MDWLVLRFCFFRMFFRSYAVRFGWSNFTLPILLRAYDVLMFCASLEILIFKILWSFRFFCVVNYDWHWFNLADGKGISSSLQLLSFAVLVSFLFFSLFRILYVQVKSRIRCKLRSENFINNLFTKVQQNLFEPCFFKRKIKSIPCETEEESGSMQVIYRFPYEKIKFQG